MMERVISDTDGMRSTEQPLLQSLNRRTSCGSPGPGEWDLFVPPNESSIPSSGTTIEIAIQTICQFLDESQIIVEEKKSFVLQDPAANTWGSLANKAISFNTKKNGPEATAFGINKLNAGEPPNWIQTIIGLRRGAFKRCPCGVGPVHYKGRLGDYMATVTRDEYKCLEGYSSCEIPTHSDWQDELNATQERRDVIELFKSVFEKCLELEADLQQRQDEIKQYMDGEESLYPKGLSLMKREYEDSKPGNPNKRARSTQSDGLELDPKSSQSQFETDDIPFHTSGKEAAPFEGECSFNPKATEDETENSTTNEPATSGSILPSSGTSTSLPGEALQAGASDRPPTPVSSARNRINRTPKEREHGAQFITDHVLQGYSYPQIRELYRAEFGIWRSASALYNHSNKGYAVTD